MTHMDMWNRLLIALGWRSTCCGARIRTEYPVGWPEREYCTECQRRLS